MTISHTPAGAFPPLITLALRPLPLLPLQLFLSAVLRRILGQHPRMFERLGPYAGRSYGLAPSDLPFAFVLHTASTAPTITVVRSLPPGLDARISGPFSALIGMANGNYDGDALFFSRTIVVEGDIEAVLALRNAVDDADLNILHEGAALLGPLRQFGEILLTRRKSRPAPDGGEGPSRSDRSVRSWN
ncbi:ubiquinone anaerobic biosynthesis accessory factor UbiT [Microvirga rosea]|uniref:ubiquinone anaerobic biosynthesis accessory factor UbiT n=1 Tax=Microvirga rosea TaxID=2715425 RepID=UPI001D0B1766|nr:SCP2 sterol-binding domain-containing protein [Microvirga rosea]MCB8820553.1 SCP2 sterol-binding domain-containing protein [Microvirga rosea]